MGLEFYCPTGCGTAAADGMTSKLQSLQHSDADDAVEV